MAKNKKGFILYADVNHTVKHLSNEQAGELFKHLLSYVNDENPVSKNPIVNIAFEPIKQQLKRDLNRWESTREKRSEAGKKSAEARKKKAEELIQQSSTNSTSVKSVEQTSTKSTVNDNVNVNVTVNDNVNNKELNAANAEKDSELEALFFNFWETYDKKKNKEKAKKAFFRLKKEEIKTIFETLPAYIRSTPDKKFRKDPITYLNQKSFNDEIISPTTTTARPSSYQTAVNASARVSAELDELRKKLRAEAQNNA